MIRNEMDVHISVRHTNNEIDSIRFKALKENLKVIRVQLAEQNTTPTRAQGYIRILLMSMQLNLGLSLRSNNAGSAQLRRTQLRVTRIGCV